MMTYNSVPTCEPVSARPVAERLGEEDIAGTSIGRINARTNGTLLTIRQKAKAIYEFLEMAERAADDPPPLCCLHDTVRNNLMLAREIEETLDAIAASLGVGQ